MARKIKQKSNLSKGEKKEQENLFKYIISGLHLRGLPIPRKEDKKQFCKEINHFTENKFIYLAFALLITGVGYVEKYLTEDVAYKDTETFDTYLKNAEAFSTKIAYDFEGNIVSNGILEVMSNKFTSWAKGQIDNGYNNIHQTKYIRDFDYTIGEMKKSNKSYNVITNAIDMYNLNKEFEVKTNKKKRKRLIEKMRHFTPIIKKEDVEMIDIIFLKDGKEFNYSIRAFEYNFMCNLANLLKTINLLIATHEPQEKDLVEELLSVVIDLQTISDYMFFEFIVSDLEERELEEIKKAS